MNEDLIFRALSGRAAPPEGERVAEWLTASPANAGVLDEVVAVLRLTADADDDLTFGPAPTGEAILAARGNGRRSGRGRPRAWRNLTLIAAAVATVAIGLPFARHLPMFDDAPSPAVFGSEEFMTETRPATVGLRDGTVVRLAPETRLRVHERPGAREVSLAGRGYFAVEHDPAAPFTIRGEAASVTVLGTRFDLTMEGDDLRLIVIEGRVRLRVRGADVVVRAGQLARVLHGTLVPPVDVPDPESLVDWVGDFIAFQNTPLSTVAREIEQRHDVRVEFTDAALGERTVTAFFAGRTFDEIAEVICVITRARCTRTGDVLRMAP